MKQNVAAASTEENLAWGAFSTTMVLAELQRKIPNSQLGFVGHSVG